MPLLFVVVIVCLPYLFCEAFSPLSRWRIMASVPQNDISESPTEVTDRPSVRLPPAENFDHVNENFATISDLMTAMFKGIEEHAQHTNANLTQIAQETGENLEKLAADMKSILSSQTMMLTICVIAVCAVVLTIKGLYELSQIMFS